MTKLGNSVSIFEQDIKLSTLKITASPDDVILKCSFRRISNTTIIIAHSCSYRKSSCFFPFQTSITQILKCSCLINYPEHWCRTNPEPFLPTPETPMQCKTASCTGIVSASLQMLQPHGSAMRVNLYIVYQMMDKSLDRGFPETS